MMSKTLGSLLLLSLVCCVFHSLKAQNSVSGKVESETDVVSYANVILFTARDSVLVKGGLSDENGRFEISGIPDGSYYLTVSMMGYVNTNTAPFELQNRQHLTLDTIVLSEQVLLDEVVVNIEKPLYEQKVDRMVINVESSILSAGSTALEVLERSPGVAINRQNSSITLIGKSGVTIMINGKISYLPPESIVQMLEGMSSDNIETIELITTPPANLDAEGNAGFINIVLKERTDVGLNGNYSLSGGVGNGATTNNNINFNFRKNKFNLFGNYSFLYRTQGQTFSFSRQFVNQEDELIDFASVSARDPIQRNHNARLGFDYQVSEKTIIGMILSGYDNKWTMDAVTTSEELTNGEPSEYIIVYNDERNQWSNVSFNANFKHNFKEDGFVSADYDYLGYRNENPTNYLNEYYDPEGNFLYDEVVRSDKTTPIDIHVIAVDYNNTLSERLTLEFGAKGAFSGFMNDVVVENLEGDEFVEDPTLTNSSVLDEQILAAYGSADYSISKKVKGKLGLRYEHTVSVLETDKEGVVVDRSFGELFPSVFLTHTLNDSLSFNYSYSRRITRPTFSQMAPFVIFFDPNTFFAGNPAIQPAISNSFKAGMNYKSYVFSAQYTLERGTISRFEQRFDEENERLVFVADNLDEVNTFALTFGLPFRITDWWKTQNTMIFLFTEVKNESENSQFEIDQFTFSLNSTNMFTITDSWMSELNFNFNSQRVFGSNRVGPTFIMNWGIQKKFGDKWGTLRFNINDIFDSFELNVTTDLPDQNIKTDNTFDFSNRTFLLTYTRSFGNRKLKALRTKQSGAQEERRRVN